MFHKKTIVGSVLCLLVCGCLLPGVCPLDAAPAGEGWNYLPQDDIGATDFKAEHPDWDGRGVVVAILDTGIDAFAPGLLETTTGQVKLIEARDFATEGNWQVVAAELDDSGTDAAPVFRDEDGLLLRGAGALAVPPVVGDEVAYPVYMGVIRARQFLNNDSVHDTNDDGDTADAFGFLVYLAERAAVEEALGVGRGLEFLQELNETARTTVARERRSAKVWLVVVDTDGNGDLADETLLRDYHVNWDTFGLASDNNPDSRTLMAWEVNVLANEDQLGNPEPPTVEFHFDDGSHGSHCAGIAAGYQVSGQPGLDGVAPGAWLISCKLGDNRLSGGATRTGSMRKAYEFAAEFGRKYDLPVVINMSFGIQSVEEGDDAMSEWLDAFLADHPRLFVCQSAGNSGPGLSTVGLPSTSISCISSGAYLSVGTGSDLYNADMQQNSLFAFSSRGGECAKPDVVAPGSALSTVPGFVDGTARYNGTSMASPQTAGAVACLVSAAEQEGLDVHWGMVKRALIAGGTPVAGLSLNDQGGGLVSLEPSWQVLAELAESESAHQVLWYRIETECLFQQDNQSDAAYWRTPGGVPFAPHQVTFTVHPIFHPDLDPDARDTFYRSFRLKSEADWLKVIPGKRYIRGDMGMTIPVQYDGDRLREPGDYAARVLATLDGGDLGGLAAREFYLWNTVVVGEKVGVENGFRKTWRGKDMPASWVKSYYVDVPASASAMRVRLEVSPRVGAGEGARVLTEICDPEGHNHGGFAGYATVDGQQVKDLTVLAPDLYPGTWEVNVVTSIAAMDRSAYELSVAFDGYQVAPATISSLARADNGDPATAELQVTRLFDGVFRGDAVARIDGFSRQETITVEDTDEWTMSFTLDGTTPRAEFELTMEQQTGNLFTDCSVNILDDAGHAVRSGAIGGLGTTMRMALPSGRDTADYTLQIVGGFAREADMASWDFELEQRYVLASPVGGEVQRSGDGALHLYCGVPAELEVSFSSTWPQPPAKLRPYGAVRFRDTNTDDKLPGDRDGRLVLEVPIRLE